MGRIAYQVPEFGPVDSLLTYASITQGFKSGGFNGRAVTLETFEVPFDPETVIAYELGFKSQLWGNRIQLNADGFFSDYDDMQVTIFDAVAGAAVTQVENAAKAEIWGAEVEIVTVPVDGLDVRMSWSFLSPEYKKFCETSSNGASSSGCAAGQVDVAASRKFVSSPENTFGIDFGDAFGIVGNTYGAPHTYGFELDWNFTAA